MPSPSPSRTTSAPGQILRGFVIIVTAGIIAAALWTALTTIGENMRFAQAINQMLHLVAAAHDHATTDKNFATLPGEDLLNDLSRAGLVGGVSDGTPATLLNPWKGNIVSSGPAASIMRIETDLPDRVCRRLAIFFAKNGGDLGLTIIEMRAEGQKIWQRPYDRDSQQPTNSEKIEDACEQSPHVTLAFVFALR